MKADTLGVECASDGDGDGLEIAVDVLGDWLLGPRGVGARHLAVLVRCVCRWFFTGRSAQVSSDQYQMGSTVFHLVPL